MLIYVLALSPALFSLALLGDFVRSWFVPTVIGGNPMLLFLLLIGPHAIRKRTQRMIQRLLEPLPSEKDPSPPSAREP